MTNEAEFRIIDSLYPDFTEYANDERFHYWMDYACELDEIAHVQWLNAINITDYINNHIRLYRAGSAKHDACVDVALNLEESLSTIYKGVFKYD